MKKLIIIGLVLLSFRVGAQIVKPEPVTYTEEFVFEGVSQEELFAKAKTWFAAQFDDPSSIISVENKESGKLIAGSSLPYSDPRIEYGTEYNDLNGLISYTITLDISEGLIKFTMSDFIHRAFPYGSKGIQNSMGLITTADTFTGKLYGYNAAAKKQAWERIKLAIDDFARNIMSALKESVEANTSGRVVE